MGIFSRLFGRKKSNISDYLDRGAIILDVRTKTEYNEGAIDGCIHIPLQQLAVRISEIKKENKSIITYCTAGVRANTAAKILRKNGVDAINGGSMRSLQKRL